MASSALVSSVAAAAAGVSSSYKKTCGWLACGKLQKNNSAKIVDEPWQPRWQQVPQWQRGPQRRRGPPPSWPPRRRRQRVPQWRREQPVVVNKTKVRRVCRMTHQEKKELTSATGAASSGLASTTGATAAASVVGASTTGVVSATGAGVTSVATDISGRGCDGKRKEGDFDGFESTAPGRSDDETRHRIYS